jgi:hypothetical protein
VSTQVAEPQQEARKKRGRETAADMVRSLGLVLLVIVPVWFFAKAPPQDEAVIRVVDPSGAISAFSADVPEAPVPDGLPEAWRATSATYSGAEGALRVGWVTPSEEYAEYAASTGSREEFLESLVGEKAESGRAGHRRRRRLAELRRAGRARARTSRPYGDATVVVGTKRATASDDELAVLLGSLAAG